MTARDLFAACLLAALASPSTAPSIGRGAIAAAQTAARPSSRLKPCDVAGVETPALCGTFDVFEDRATRRGRTIALKVVVLPAAGPNRQPDPVVYLAGGGVLPATRYGRFFAQRFAALRESRDILLIDQRGTGASNPLDCRLPPPDQMGTDAYLAAVRGCRAELESRADLRLYGTAAAMDDLDDVRAWLGYDQVNVWGMSYGSFAAQVYVRQHPDRVRTLTLTGPMPLDAPMWLDLAGSAQDVLEKVLAACESQDACRAAYPGVRGELDAVLDRLARQPVSVPVTMPDGSASTIRFTDRQLRDMLVGALYSARAMGDVPHLVHAVFSGDLTPLQAILGEAAPPDAAAPRGVFLSLLCTESIPKIDPAAIPAATRGTFFGDFPIRAQMRVCEEWPRAVLPGGFSTPVRSAIPLLAVVGELDHTTPPRYAEAIASGFPNGRVVALPGRGHNDIDPCVARIITSFIESGRAEGADPGCATASQPLTFRLPPPR